jgi:hypothetical protein
MPHSTSFYKHDIFAFSADAAHTARRALAGNAILG